MDVLPGVLWVAGQELILSNDLYGWARCMAPAAAARESELGRSVGGRPLLAWKLGNDSSRDLVVILGRQHPPEVTGSLALMAFVDTLAGDSEAARRFRRRYQVLVVPLLNPDGVELGHWRCNLNGIDLNRDWVKFSQPETQCVRKEIERLVSAGKRPSLLLDFHSTNHDVFYTQADDETTVPQDFAKRWLAGVHERLPEYQFRRDGSHENGQATSKAWGYGTYRIPAITYEVGDNTDRSQVRKVASTAAEEMMRLLLGYPAGEKLPPATPAPAKPLPVPSLN
jgi:predicted deacylase